MAAVRISRVFAVGKMSPSNFKEASITRSKLRPLGSYLDAKKPFEKGSEPGAAAYHPRGQFNFLRNSCIDDHSYTQDASKHLQLVRQPSGAASLGQYDILLCKDANIGDACVFMPEDDRPTYISSGVARLNFADEADRFYCLAMLRHPFFREQLDAITPRGSTIRHAGKLFLDCLIPELRPNELWVRSALAAAIKNVAHAERLSQRKIEAAAKVFRDELLSNHYTVGNPRVSAILSEKRLDAGFYSEAVSRVEHAISNYPGGSATVEDFGFAMKRGPNLQKRDMGRSVQRDTPRAGYHALVYPSSVSDRGYIEETKYLGARSLVWHIEAGGVLFSAEGTVGKSFAICDDSVTFITNIHGLILSPKQPAAPHHSSAYLCMFLHFLRKQEFFDKISVGGQGGSLAVSYWNKVKVPLLPADKRTEIATLYTAGAATAPVDVFDLTSLERMGVYQLNNFRSKCMGFVADLTQAIHDDTVGEFVEARAELAA